MLPVNDIYPKVMCMIYTPSTRARIVLQLTIRHPIHVKDTCMAIIGPNPQILASEMEHLIY